MRFSPLPQHRAFIAKVSGFVVLSVALLLLGVAHANAAPSTSAPAAPLAGNIGNFIWQEPRYSFNGLQNAGEPGIPFAPVNLYDVDGTTLISVTNANASGIYNLNIPTNGSYTIDVPNPSNASAGFDRSPQDANANTNDTIDSDVDTIFGQVPIVVAGANNSTIDAAFHDRPTSNTFCAGRQLTFTDWSGAFTLPQSNPLLGTLTGVFIRAGVGSAQDATIMNTGLGTQNFSYEGGALVLLTMPYGAPSPTTNVTTGRLVTGITLAQGQSVTFLDLVDYRFTDYAVPSGTRPLYVGTGTFNINATAQGRSAFTGGGNLSASATTEAYTSVCVTYLYSGPLAATLNSFEAQCRDTSNDIQVAWETASEVNTLGFNVLRGTDANTPGDRVNGDLIPAQATGGSGAAYEWADTAIPGDGTYYYWLESVDTDGNTALNGPVNASYPCAPTAVTLNSITAQSTPISVPPMLAALVGAGVVVLAGAAATWRKR